MRRLAVLLVALVLLVAGTHDSLAARATALLDPLEAALQARVADVATPAKLRKLYKADLQRLAKTTTTLKQDVASAAAILPAIEKKAVADTALVAVASDTVDALTVAVAAHLAGVQAQAATIPAKKPSPIVRITNLLTRGQSALAVAQGAGSILLRISSLKVAIVKSFQANNAVQKALNPGGGGGGGGLCGPTPKPAGLRGLGASESFALHLTFPAEEFDFAANTVTAKVGPAGGIQGQPTALTIDVYDCTHGDHAQIALPYPPTVDVEYVNGMGGNQAVVAAYGAIDGLTQLFPGGVHVKATAFDAQAKTITIEFHWSGTDFTNGHATIRNWTGQ